MCPGLLRRSRSQSAAFSCASRQHEKSIFGRRGYDGGLASLSWEKPAKLRVNGGADLSHSGRDDSLAGPQLEV